jgi:restriction endonuclease Mrr
MLSRLAAMARRPRDRKVIVTAKDTFGLVDWGLPEDAAALAVTGIVEPNPEEALPPLRTLERHPEPRAENARGVGRGDRKRHRDEDGDRGRRKRFPPIPEVVFEILSETEGGLTSEELATRAVERELASEELGKEQILHALLDDNQRRIDAGRRPQFVLDKTTGQLTLERAGAPSQVAPLELQAAFAAALGIPLEAGRPVLARASERTGESAGDLQVAETAMGAAKDAKRAMARVLRRKLAELDPGTFEKSVVRMMQGLGFRDLKVAKRSKDGPLVTARRREGSVELRYAVKVARGGAPVDRRAVQELRRDLGHYASQVGLLLSPGDVRGDARAEAQSQGALVMLWCSEGLAEKFFEAKVGVTVQHIELYDVDERFFEQAKLDAEESRARREERHRERDGGDEARPAATPAEGFADSAVASERPDAPVSAESEGVPAERVESAPRAAEEVSSTGGDDDEDDDDDAEGDDEGSEGDAVGAAGAQGPGAAAGPGQPGERKRRRRRRRGRRGRSPRPGEAALPGAAPQVPGADVAAAVAVAAPPPSEAPAAPVAPPEPAAPPASPPAAGGEGQ